MRSHHSSNRRVEDTNDVLQVLCLLSEVAGSYGPQDAVSSDVITSNGQELLNTNVIVHDTDYIRAIHVTTSYFQHSVKNTLKQFNLKGGDLLLENTTSRIA
ncbi:hypothetical protein D3C78_878530 [compost metagenome]